MPEEKSPPPESSPPPKKEKQGGVVDMAANMAKMTVMLGGLGLAIKLVTSPIKALTSLPGLANKMVGGFTSLTKAFSGLDISLSNLSKAFSAGLATADKLQQKSIGFGTSFESAGKAFAGSVDKMPGTLSQNLGTMFDAFETGLRGNTVRVAQLAAINKQGGKSAKQTLQAFEGFQTSMSMNNDELNNLAEATIKAQFQHKVSSEQLMNAVNSLAEETKNVAVFDNLGDEFGGAITDVAGMLGGRGEKDLAKVMKLLTGGMETYGEASRLGLLGMRQRMASAKNENDVRDVLLAAMKQGAAVTENWNTQLGGVGDLGIKADVLTGTLSDSTTSFMRLNNLLKVEEASMASNMEMETDVLNTLKQQALELWEPITNLWLDSGKGLFQKLLDNAQEIQAAFTAYIVNPIRDIIEGFTGSMLENSNLMDGLKQVFQTVGAVITWVAETLGSTMGGEGGSMYSKVTDFFFGILKNIAEGFDDFVLGTLPAIEVAFLSVAVVILKALNKIPGIDVEASTIASLDRRRGEAKLGSMTSEDVMAMNLGGGARGTGQDKILSAESMVGGTLGVAAGGILGAKLGAVVGSVVPGVGTAIGAGLGGLGGMLIGGIGGWLAGDAVEEKINSTFGDFYVQHPITGVEESFKSREEAMARGNQIQAEVLAEVEARRGQQSMTERLLSMQADALKEGEEANQASRSYEDILKEIQANAEEQNRKTPEPDEGLEILPGTEFQSTIGQVLSESMLAVLMDTQTRHEEFINTQENTAAALERIGNATEDTAVGVHDKPAPRSPNN
jgi:hypothetical protein